MRACEICLCYKDGFMIKHPSNIHFHFSREFIWKKCCDCSQTLLQTDFNVSNFLISIISYMVCQTQICVLNERKNKLHICKISLKFLKEFLFGFQFLSARSETLPSLCSNLLVTHP